MKLNEEAKTKMRSLIEEEFKKVPEGSRVKLDNELIDELIFSYGYWKDDGDTAYKEFKVPVWTPDCLSKIDLSELSFKNVWIASDEVAFGDFDSETEKKYKHGFPYTLSREERRANQIPAYTNFKNTNIKIDFRDAVSWGHLLYWNLSGVDLSNSHIDCLYGIEGCDLSNTNIVLDNVDWFIKQPYDDNKDDNENWCEIYYSNFSGNDLSKVRFNIENLEDNNFSNTGLRIRYDKGIVDDSAEEKLRESLKDGYLVGCYLNDILIKENDTLEDILNRAKLQEQELLNNISNTLRSQISVNNNTLVGNEEISMSEDENKKHI